MNFLGISAYLCVSSPSLICGTIICDPVLANLDEPCTGLTVVKLHCLNSFQLHKFTNRNWDRLNLSYIKVFEAAQLLLNRHVAVFGSLFVGLRGGHRRTVYTHRQTKIKYFIFKI